MSTGSMKHGLWTDHSRSAFNRHQLLVDDYSAGIITNTVAVLITLMSKVIWALLKNSTDRIWHHLSSNWWNHTFTSSLDQAHDTHEAAMIVLEDFMSGIKVIAIGLSSTKRLVQNIRRVYAAFKGEPGPALISVLVVLALLAFPVLLLVASIVSAGLATDGIAISQSPSCGYYATKNHSSPFLVYEHGAERRAATYKEKCYGSDSNTDDCTQFFNQSIAYSINSKARCPFHGDICATGSSGAYSLSTGLVSGAVLGINAANPYFFNRTMICAPLCADDKYIDIGETKQGEEQWEYFYGKGSTEECTWQNPVKESSWEIKGYSTGIFCSQPGSTKSPFVPRSEFSAGPYPVTLLFISSHRILYPRYSDDPVFPARKRSKFPAGYKGQPHYFNNSTRAGVLGCVDQYQICRTELGPCWDNSNINSILQAPDNRTATEEEAVASLLVLSLDYSTACGSIEFRGAEGLQAQSKIAHIQSLPLALNQWQVESESLFQTSLARIQGNIFDFARGTAAGVEGYVNTLPDNYRGMCELVKIPTRGWTNINFVGLVGIFVGCLMLFGFSQDSGISGKLIWDGLKLIPWTKLMLPLKWLWQRSARFRKWTKAMWEGIMLELSQLLHRIMTYLFS